MDWGGSLELMQPCLAAEAHSAQRHIKTNELIGGPNTSFDGAIRDFVGGSAGGAY
jgi:hypothetical protein